MKIVFSAIRSGLYLLTGLVFGCSVLTSCKDNPAPLPLFGEWQEKQYKHYDSTFSHSRYRLFLDCPNAVQDSLKKGDFSLFVKALHMPSYQNERTFVYMEYIKGVYWLDENRKKLNLDGLYYTDSSFSVIAADSNTDFSFGPFRSASDYRLDDLTLTLSLDDSTRTDINTFYPVNLKENCF